MSLSPDPNGDRAPVGWREPIDVLAQIRDEAGTLLLQGGSDPIDGRFSYLCAFPDFMIVDPDPVTAFAALKAHKGRLKEIGDSPRFEGGFAGLLSYELGGAFERMAPQNPGRVNWPALALGWYPAVIIFDHHARQMTIAGEPAAAQRLTDLLHAGPLMDSSALDAAPGHLDPVWEEARYGDAARRAVDYVRAGDVFQVNLSHPFRGTLPGRDGPFRLMTRLTAQSPASHAAYFRLDAKRCIVTNSPERFLKLDPSGRVETRPIKGTAARQSDPEIDAEAARSLQASPKDQAENLMIVDLMRNDLSRVCTTGSVRVPDLFKLESFANVHHLVSTVTGQLRPDLTLLDLIAAAFPPGSITGAPKVRAMEIISELEGEARGPYCGALGWIGANGAADLNVMIRTAACVRCDAGWQVEVRSGGAITIDSDPEAELRETHAKAGALLRAVSDG